MTTLHLGCGHKPLAGAVNHDLVKHSPWVDVTCDLDALPWPWGDASFSKIVAVDVFEHLRVDVADWLREAWRILVDGGRLVLQVPHWSGENAWTDPTHRRAFSEKTLSYFCPGTEYHAKYGSYYWPDGPWWRQVVAERIGDNIGFELVKLLSAEAAT